MTDSIETKTTTISNEETKRIKGIIESLSQQRNVALDQLAVTNSMLKIAQEELAQLKSQMTSGSSDVSTR